MDTALILIGVACVIGAIIGGGIKMQVIEMRSFESLWRQFILALFGVGLIMFGLNMRKETADNAIFAAHPDDTPAVAAQAEPVNGPAQKPEPEPTKADPPPSPDFRAKEKATYVGPPH